MYLAKRVRLLRAALLTVAGLMAGCATPNLQPFAEQTARLAGAVSGEHTQIALRLDHVIELSAEACARSKRAARADGGQVACSQTNQRRSDAKAFAESRRIIDSFFEKAVNYASTLAALAAAGETGGAAAQSLLSTVREFGTVIGVGGMAATAGVATILEKVAVAATRVQAQNSLEEAMAAAQPAVDALADGIRDISSANDRILDALHSDEKDALLTIAGVDVVGLFQDASTSREIVSSRLRERRAALAELRGCGAPQASSAGDPCAPLLAELRNAEELGRLLDHLRPEYDGYTTRRNAALKWRAERRENSAGIVKATAAWKAEHARVVEWLRRCGGTQAHHCVEVNVATLKVVIDTIEDIRSERSR